jgi:hypothetical protein
MRPSSGEGFPKNWDNVRSVPARKIRYRHRNLANFADVDGPCRSPWAAVHPFSFSVLSTSTMHMFDTPYGGENSNRNFVVLHHTLYGMVWSGSGDQEHCIYASPTTISPPPTSIDTSGCEAARVALAVVECQLVQLNSIPITVFLFPGSLPNASNETWFC